MLRESSLDLNFPPFSERLCCRDFVEIYVIKVAHLLQKWKQSKTKRLLVPRLHNRWKILQILEIHLVSNLKPAANTCLCMVHNMDSLSFNFLHILDEIWITIRNYGCLQLLTPKKVCFHFWTNSVCNFYNTQNLQNLYHITHLEGQSQQKWKA